MVRVEFDASNQEDRKCVMDMLSDTLRKKYDELKASFENLEQTKDSLAEEKKTLEYELEQVKSNLKKKEDECEKYEDSRKWLIEEKKKLDNKINELEKRLEESGKSDDSVIENPYCVVSGDRLEQSAMSNNAFYVIKGKEGTLYKFVFNEDAPHQRAIQDKKNLLDPFCELEEEETNANFVETRSAGYLKRRENSSVFDVRSKAVVRLIRR